MVEGGFCNTEIKYAKKRDLVNIIGSYDQKTLLLASGNRLEEWGIKDEAFALFDKRDIFWMDRRIDRLNEQDVYETLVKVTEYKPDIIITVGGGSRMDLAKAVSALYGMELHSEQDVLKAIVDKRYIGKHHYLPIIAIPTTAGTGSEVTRWATVWRKDGKEKLSMDCPGIQPNEVYWIPELTLTLPKRVTLATGLDALAQAMESYWAKASGPIVKDMAIRAIDMIMDALPKLMLDLKDVRLRERMSRGALLSGIAFSKTRTTACHSISYALTGLHNVEHGFAVALTLEQVSRMNKPYMEEPNELFALLDRYGGLKEWLDSVCEGVQELTLQAFGINKESIREIAEGSFTFGRMDNNPVFIRKEQVKRILENVYESERM